MGAAMRHAYLDARVSLMASRLLSEADIERLIDAPAQGEQDSEWLGEAIGLDEEGVAGIDRGLMPRLLSELSILLRGLYRQERELVRFWARRFELANIKTLLRGKMSGHSDESLREQLVDLGQFSQVSTDKLLLSSDTAEMLRQLEQSVYADFAREMRLGLSKQQELFTIDASIDRHYFGGLATRARSVGTSARVLVGSMIDRVNLVWLLRYRFAYELPPAQTYYQLVPAGHLLTRETLLELTRLESLSQVLESLPPPFSELLADAASTSEVTRRLEIDSWETARRILVGQRFNPTRALAYLILRERDLRRIRAIVRGRRLQMDPRMLRMATGLVNVDTALDNNGEAA